MEIKDPILIFSFMMAILLVAPLIFARMKLPGILGLIISGVIIGPHALGILKPEGSIQLFASVGLIYIMFLAGLEINLHEFNRQRKYSIVFGILTFLIPMLVGTLGGKILFSFTWPCALLLASMFASHTLIPFPITSRLGINKERSVIATVGGTIITDTAAILVLAFVAEWATTQLTAIFWVRQFFFLALLVWFALWILPRIAFFIFRILAPSDQVEFILILALVFFTAHLAHLAGAEPIIGAFFAGLALSRVVSEQSPLMNRLEFVGNTLFIPFFLVSVGMLVNLKVLVSGWDVWAVAAFMVACGILCKYFAAMAFVRIMKFTNEEGKLIFGLSVNQAAATLAAVIVGYRIGIFNEAILNGTIVMIFVTCLIGPWFTEKYGRKIAKLRLKVSHREIKQNERIMIAVGRDESVQLLTDIAILLHGKDSAEPLFPLFVAQDGLNVEQRIASGEKLLGKVVARVVSANLPVSAVSRIDVNVAEGILHALKEWHIGTLVMGASRYSSNVEALLFDVGNKIREESRQMIFLCRMDHSLSIDQGIILFIPPMIEAHEGFALALRAVCTLCAANKLKLRIVAFATAITHIEKNFKKEMAKLDAALQPLQGWKEFSRYLSKASIKEGDALFFMAARKDRLAWQPSFERLCQKATELFPRNNMFLIHPPAKKAMEENEPPLQAQEGGADDLVLSLPKIKLAQSASQEALQRLLENYFASNSRQVTVLKKKLLRIEPIELSSDVLLFHAHDDVIDKPVILLGLSSDEFIFMHRDQKIKAMFILISPEGQSEIHLQALTKVARMVKRLKESPSA